MTYSEAKEKYKGLNIKILDDKTGNSKGYYSINKTQYIFKSEITGRFKNSKNAFYVDGQIFLLPDPLKKKLQMHIAKEIDSVPSGVDYDVEKERYNVKLDYLQLVKDEKSLEEKQKELTEESIKTEYEYNAPVFPITQTTSIYSSDLLNRVSQEIQKHRLLDSVEFLISNDIVNKESLIDVLEDQILQLEEGKGDIVKLMVTAVLYDKINISK